MKKVVECCKGIESLLGQRVTLFGLNYIYTGDLIGLDKIFAYLENAAIVYETGAFDEKAWKDAQTLPNPIYVRLASIESATILK